MPSNLLSWQVNRHHVPAAPSTASQPPGPGKMTADERISSMSGKVTPITGSDQVKNLKSWQDSDSRSLSVERDLWATAKLCEILRLCSFDEAVQGFRAPFNELAELRYAGYCYYDFASVSMNGLFDAYQELLREHLGDANLESIHIWMWTGWFLNSREPDSRGNVRIIFENIEEPDETSVFFGRFLRCDHKFGVAEGQTTKVDLISEFSKQFDKIHPGFKAFGVPDKDIAILRTMDLINEAYPQPGDEGLMQRIPFNHAFTDIGAGRWIEGDRYGHLFIYPDGSIGVEGFSGFENERHVIALGAEKILSVQ
jgi:hypothetical protein